MAKTLQIFQKPYNSGKNFTNIAANPTISHFVWIFVKLRMIFPSGSRNFIKLNWLCAEKPFSPNLYTRILMNISFPKSKIIFHSVDTSKFHKPQKCNHNFQTFKINKPSINCSPRCHRNSLSITKNKFSNFQIFQNENWMKVAMVKDTKPNPTIVN